MLKKMYKEAREECQRLMEENERLKNDKLFFEKWNDEFSIKCQSLVDENRYLKQRLKELRHKSWFPVYEENLKLTEENKNLDETCKEVIVEYEKLEKEVEQYKNVLKSVEQFIGQYSKEKKVDVH
jgi:DNA repair exonuclease SbcCD ATPase subunit